MRWGAFISLIGLSLASAGCASKPQAGAPVPPVAQEASVYEGAVAASLVYTPPAVNYAEPPDLSREDRAPSAYYGFEDITTYYYLYQNDTQFQWGGGWGCRRGFNGDQFERRAITERVGVVRR